MGDRETLYGPECACCLRRGMVRLKDTDAPMYQCPRTGDVHVLRVGAIAGVYMQPVEKYRAEMALREELSL